MYNDKDVSNNAEKDEATNVPDDLHLTGKVFAVAADDSPTETVCFVQITAKFDFSKNISKNHTVSDSAKYIIEYF